MIDSIEVGKKIKALRKEKSLTQDDLANELMVTRQVISKWEHGYSLPSVDLIIELSKLLSVPIDDLLCLSEGEIVIDESNIFKGHNRKYIVDKIINGKLKVDLIDVFYQFSPLERILVIKAIKEGKIAIDRSEFSKKLSVSEKRLLYGNDIHICQKGDKNRI